MEQKTQGDFQGPGLVDDNYLHEPTITQQIPVPSVVQSSLLGSIIFDKHASVLVGH
jgi:hypothetical protein